jgi:NAD(P)H-dependent flavin oxidoreductase YrpB (nitropropane dioxygenase family)
VTAPAPALRTRICDLFGIEVPVVQTGMGWVAGPRLAAATSAAGGLGVLAAATMTLAELTAAIAEVKDRTDRPFGVNLRSEVADVDERVDLLIRERVPVASFAQAPGERITKRLRDAGVCVVPTVGAPRHAEKVAAWGVDAVIAQGAEGGGHTGVVPTSLLVPAVVDAVDVPVVAAGGFFDGRGLVAALAWGAAGIAMGTRFLLTAESTVPEATMRRYLAAGLADTVVTRRIDGVPQRVIRTSFVERLEGSGRITAVPRALASAWRFRRLTGRRLPDLLREARALRRTRGMRWAEVLSAANAPMLTRAALVGGEPDAGVLPTGQVVGLIEARPTVAEVIASVVAEAQATLVRLGVGCAREEPA